MDMWISSGYRKKDYLFNIKAERYKFKWLKNHYR